MKYNVIVGTKKRQVGYIVEAPSQKEAKKIAMVVHTESRKPKKQV